jgi:hypothetical protein
MALMHVSHTVVCYWGFLLDQAESDETTETPGTGKITAIGCMERL